MNADPLCRLATHVGVAPEWRDAFGRMQTVSTDSLRSVLAALDVPALTDAEVADSLARLAAPAAASTLPPLITADAGVSCNLPGVAGNWRLTLEHGEVLEGRSADGSLLSLPAINQPGYHLLEVGDACTRLAVAPPRCFAVRDADPSGRLWGLAAQLYSLRRKGDGGIGDFAALAQFVSVAGRNGADALAISPIHAQFSADPDRFSPYSPSSRVQLNVLHASVDELLVNDQDAAFERFESLSLVDWPHASRARLARFRRAYEIFSNHPSHPLHEHFVQFREQEGETLECHARFEALHDHLFGSDPALWNWRTWPEKYRNPAHAAVGQFAHDHAHEVGFHAFLQFMADRGLAAAQKAAIDAGMKIGLVSDLAVGTDGGGSHAWARQGETLIGLSIGAPPDILNARGQDWGLAAFSPTGLLRHGYTAYLEMLRCALRHAGGVRIDHVMGLARLWVLPEGATPSEGAYLQFPLHDLLRLISLESTRRRAVILGEDLGTVPDGFQQQIDTRNLMGLRVLWFEADPHQFKDPLYWTRQAAAMTSTHDLATVAGWWTGHDLDLGGPLGMLGDASGIWHAHDNRARDRIKLWDAMLRSGAVQGFAPAPEQPAEAVSGALRHVARSNCELALLPVEDVIGTVEQPNVPGTTNEHPNWQRRLSFDAEQFFTDPDIAARIDMLNAARPAGH